MNFIPSFALLLLAIGSSSADATSSPTNSPTPAISSWRVEHISTFADFNQTSSDEITLEYKIGAGRVNQVTLYQPGCEDGGELNLDSDGISFGTDKSVTPIEGDPSHEKLSVFLNVTKNATVLDDLYNATDKTISFCAKVDLLNNGGDVIKYEKTDVDVILEFNNTFEIENINLTQIYVGDDSVATQVLDYVDACACNPAATDSSAPCDVTAKVITNVQNDDRLKVCVYSTSTDMEINYLDRLVLEAGSTTEDYYVIVDVANRGEGASAFDGETAAVREYPGWNGVYVESIVPTNYFSYDADVIASVTGVVFLKLAGSRRRLAVELTGHESDVVDATSGSGSSRALQSPGDQESAFAVNFELQKSELELGDADINGAAGALMSGIIGSVAATIIMMW